MSDLGVRETSKAFFGNRYRLEIIAAITEYRGKRFSAKALELKTEIFYPRVHEVLRGLAKEGAIKKLGRGPGNRIEYVAIPSPFWNTARRLLTQLKREG